MSKKMIFSFWIEGFLFLFWGFFNFCILFYFFGNHLMMQWNKKAHFSLLFLHLELLPLNISLLPTSLCFLLIHLQTLFGFFELFFLILTSSQQNALYVPCHQTSVQTSSRCYRSTEGLLVLAPRMPLTKCSLSALLVEGWEGSGVGGGQW